MQSFKLFYEEYLLEDVSVQELNAAFNNIVNILRDMGYTLIKDDSSYQMRVGRKISVGEPSRMWYDKNKEALFTLAHEFAHALQWKYPDPKDKDIKLSDFKNFDRFQEREEELKVSPFASRGDTFNPTANLIHSDNVNKLAKSLKKIWYELDAWVGGLEYIPKDLHPEYKHFLKEYLNTYFNAIPQGIEVDFNDFEHLTDMMNALDYTVEDLPPRFQGLQ